MRVAIYARVSTDEQNPDMQIQRLRQAAAARGWEALEFSDIASGAAGVLRPERERMLAMVRERTIEGVAIWKLDRLGRSALDLWQVAQEIDSAGVFLFSQTENLDTATPTGRFCLRMFASIAELERDVICQRVREGVRAAQRRGVHCGRPRRFLDWDLYAMLRSEGRSMRDIAAVMSLSERTIRRAVAGRGDMT